MEDKPTIMVGGPDGDVCPGSKKYACVKCGSPAWLAPSGQRMVKKQSLQVICVFCFLKLDGEQVIQTPTADQIAEDMGIINRN